MSRPHGVVRKSGRPQVLGFEERRWPAVTGLAALATLACWLIVTGGSVADPRPVEYARIYCSVVVLAALLLAVLSRYVSHVISRRLQLAFLISIAGHILLAIALREQSLQMVRVEKSAPLVPEPEQEVRLPEELLLDYFESATSWEELQALFRAPTTEIQSLELTRQQQTPRASEAMRQASRLPETLPPTEPTPLELRRPEMAAPHRAPDPSLLSRQDQQAAAIDQRAAAAPHLNTVAGRPASPLAVPTSDDLTRGRPSLRIARARRSTSPPQPIEDPDRPTPLRQVASSADTPVPQPAAPPRGAFAPDPADVADTQPREDPPLRPQAPQREPSPGAPPTTTAARRADEALRPPSRPYRPAQVGARKPELERPLTRRAAMASTSHAIDRPLTADAPKKKSVANDQDALRAAGDLGAEPIGLANEAAASAARPLGVATPPDLARSTRDNALQRTRVSLPRRRSPPSARAVEEPPPEPSSALSGTLPNVRQSPDVESAMPDGPEDPLEPVVRRDRTLDLSIGIEAVDAPPGPEQSTAVLALTPSAEALGKTAGRLPVQVDAPPNQGGLSGKITPEVGLPGRRARRESALAHRGEGRYLKRKVGAPAAVDGRVREAADAFNRRGLRQRERQSGGDGTPRPRTEEAIELGLTFLASQQQPGGQWSLKTGAAASQPLRPPATGTDVAATGLALLAFLGAGYDHYEDKYMDAVQRGLDYLLEQQRNSGGIYLASDERSSSVTMLYAHGIATIALCEALGMTGDPGLSEPAQRAIAFIVQSQHPDFGGWRYHPGISSDLSVTGWHLMALKSGQLAGLDVPESTLQGVVGFLERCQAPAPQSHCYIYNPHAPDNAAQRHGRRPSTVMTSVGLLMRLYTGHDRQDPELRKGADLIADNLARGESPPVFAALGNPMRDTYYWFYATQVMYHMRGRYWDSWNDHLRPLLLQSQVRSGVLVGSWDPLQPVPDRWGPWAGRLYVTAMNLLSLEVAYRHLPLYEITAR